MRSTSKKTKFKTKKLEVVSFPYYGGKVLLSHAILAQAPIRKGCKFIDLFAGRGAFTWRAWAEKMQFQQWIINDAYKRRVQFFEALRDVGNSVKVPLRSRAEYEKQRELAKHGDQRSIMLAPWLAYSGGDYEAGASSGGGGARSSGGRRSTESYEQNLRLAHKVLHEMKPVISNLDWRDCLEQHQPGEKDLVLIDPPYLNGDVGVYHPDDILPVELIAYLKTAKFNWVLCENYQPLYIQAFGEPVFKKEVQVRSVQLGKSKMKPQVECVWTSASYKAKAPRSVAATLHGLDPRIVKILEKLRGVADRVEDHRLKITTAEREELLPLIIELKRLTYRKKPGYHECLDLIHLNASTVRSWFFRGHHTDEIIDMLETEDEKKAKTPPATGGGGRGGDPGQDADELLERWFQHFDKITLAAMRNDFPLVKRLCREYAEARKIHKQSESSHQLEKLKLKKAA